MRVRFMTFLLGLSLCGCATIQDYHYCLAQKHRADSAWKSYYGTVGHGCSRDYSDGWKQGYFDISTGQCEEPPPVPPHKYWNASYATPEGRDAIADWYSGWQDGATAAVQDGTPYFHEIPASPTGAGVKGGGFYGGPAQHGGMPAEPSGPDYHEPLEKLPPTPPMASVQPPAPVHVAPVPQRFASQEIPADEGLLDEETLPASGEMEYVAEDEELLDSGEEYVADEYVTEETEEEGTDGYYAPEAVGTDATDEEAYTEGYE